MAKPVVFTFALSGDAETSVRVFKTEKKRDSALLAEAITRWVDSLDRDGWTVESVINDPIGWIEQDNPDLWVSLDSVTIED